MAVNTFIVRYIEACILVFILWASPFLLFCHIFISLQKEEKKGREKNQVPLMYETEELSKARSRESVLLCIQSLKLSVFEGSAVTGPLHGEITRCSPSLKMLTLSLTGDWEQKHMLHARWLNGNVSALWKRLACICQSFDLVRFYLYTYMWNAHTHTPLLTLPLVFMWLGLFFIEKC